VKAVFFCLSSSLAHAGRVVRLARALQARGHTAVLAGKPGFFADPCLVQPGELAVETAWEPDLAGLMAAARGEKPQLPEEVIADRMLTDELALLDRLRPDLVVTDNRRTAVISAEIKRIPSLSLVNASMLGPHCAMAPTLDSLAKICGPVLGHKPSQVLAAEAYAHLKPSDPVPLQAQPLGTRVEWVLKRHGGRPRSFVHELCFGDRSLILDPPSLMPTRNLPKGATQIGPFFPQLIVPPPPWWDQLDAARPLVYLTYGSTGGAGFAQAVKQLANLRLQFAVTTAHVDSFSSMPRVLAARYLPPEILARARLVVCHGGTQTVYQALSVGTPVLSLPGHLETALTTIALVQAKLGVTVAPSALAADAGLLRRTVESVLKDDALRQRVKAASAGFNDAAALATAVEAAESLASGTIAR
jgi:UDP:flavonoid glycosyltransferase YjiC (YdhE family)